MSACLVGRPVRYDGTDKSHTAAHIVSRWQKDGRLVLVCPEVAVGFPTPRPPAEIHGAGAELDGRAVISGTAQVFEATGAEVSALYVEAARETVKIAKQHGCGHAVLTDGSPSCGSTFIYDGTFSGTQTPGLGATAAALLDAGLRLWPHTAIEDLDQILQG